MTVGILFAEGQNVTSIDFDVTMDEAHEWTNDVTTNQVEIGAPVTDHIQPQPDRLTITGMISDSPLNLEIQSEISALNGTDERAQTAFDFLRKMHEKRILLTVYTKHKVYADMALASCNIPRSAGIGMAVNFTLQFMHVRLVSTQTVDVPPGISRKLDKKAGGEAGAVAKKTQTQAKAGAVQNKTPTTAKSILSGILGQ